MMSPRAISLQGLGFTPRLIALQGLRPFDGAPPPERPDVIPYGYGGIVTPEKKRPRRDKDDDLLLFLLR